VLVIGGGPEEAELRGCAESLGIGARTHWAGGVASAEMPEWLAALDVLVLPSRTTRGWAEQFGRVLVEAMACGVAVIGSNSGEIPSVIGDGGLVVQEGSLEELRATLAILSRDADALARWARLGRARALAEFSQRRVVEDTLAFHRRVVAA
jgi:glycosyltransferase involved in cell wall biosynthesis